MYCSVIPWKKADNVYSLYYPTFASCHSNVLIAPFLIVHVELSERIKARSVKLHATKLVLVLLSLTVIIHLVNIAFCPWSSSLLNLPKWRNLSTSGFAFLINIWFEDTSQFVSRSAKFTSFYLKAFQFTAFKSTLLLHFGQCLWH